MGKQETLETIWEVPDELWERIEPIILRPNVIFRLRPCYCPTVGNERRFSDPSHGLCHHRQRYGLPSAHRGDT